MRNANKENRNPKVVVKKSFNDDAVRRGLAFAMSREKSMEERREKERKLRDAQKEFENQMKRQTREVKSLRSKYFEALRTIKIFETKCTASEDEKEKLERKLNKIFGIEKKLRTELSRVEKRCKHLEKENKRLKKENVKLKEEASVVERTPARDMKMISKTPAKTSTPIQRILQIQQSDWSPASCAKPKRREREQKNAVVETIYNENLPITMRDPRFISGEKSSLLALVDSIDRELNM